MLVINLNHAAKKKTQSLVPTHSKCIKAHFLHILRLLRERNRPPHVSFRIIWTKEEKNWKKNPARKQYTFLKMHHKFKQNQPKILHLKIDIQQLLYNNENNNKTLIKQHRRRKRNRTHMKRTISRHCRIICGCWLFINNFGFSFNGRFRYYHEFVYSFFISFYSYCIHRPNTPNVIVNYPDFRLLCVCVFFALFFHLWTLFARAYVDILFPVECKKKLFQFK